MEFKRPIGNRKKPNPKKGIFLVLLLVVVLLLWFFAEPLLEKLF